MSVASGEDRPLLINWPAVAVLLVWPALILSGTIVYALHQGLDWLFLLVAVIGYYGSNITVGVALHRYFSHAAFKAPKWVEWVMLLFSAGTLQGPVMAWVSDHSRHHTFTDEERDPHSPLKYRSAIAGFFWAHMGWMLVKEAETKVIDRATIVRFGRNRAVLWQMEHYWKLAALMNLALPAAIGLLLWGDLWGMAAGVLAIGCGRAVQQQVTFFVNSLCHFAGRKPYVEGTAGDVWWLAPFLLGENWHNFHHAFARDFRNGHKWYHMDVHKWIILGMERLNLASDLVRTSEERVHAKVSETQLRLDDARVGLAPRLDEVRTRLEQLTHAFSERVSGVRQGAADRLSHARSDAADRLEEVQERLRQHLQEAEIEIRAARARLKTLSADAYARVGEASDRLMEAISRAQDVMTAGVQMQPARIRTSR